jgi:A/G-specific adenine glycosylase
MAWRNTRDPYRILVSEIMLQQTQVDRVRKKYTEFMKKFPTVNALAVAPLGDVLRVWSGLGYNRRAKYLHDTATRVVLEYGGVFPREEHALRGLPGIGLSTAAALSAFAFGADVPMIDTNVRRILLRVFFRPHLSRRNLDKLPSDKELYLFAHAIIPKGRGREWNYAMLDLGATACTARDHSPACPLNALHGPVGDHVKKHPQKKFVGSRRYYRGRIIEHLRKRTDGYSIGQLRRLIRTDPYDISELLSVLMNDGLVVRKKQKYFLP